MTLANKLEHFKESYNSLINQVYDAIEEGGLIYDEVPEFHKLQLKIYQMYKLLNDAEKDMTAIENWIIDKEIEFFLKHSKIAGGIYE